MGEDGEKTGVWSFEESEEKIGKMGRTGGGRLGRSEEKWSGGTRLHVNDMKMFVLLDSHLFSELSEEVVHPWTFHTRFFPVANSQKIVRTWLSHVCPVTEKWLQFKNKLTTQCSSVDASPNRSH